MRYGIIGTGAIGGYYGAKLAHAGQEVHFLLHSDYEYVKQHGLQVDSCDGSFHLDDVNAYGQTKDMPACDVVLVGLKSVNNDKLQALLPPLLHDKAASKREQSDARIDSAEREQARPKVKTAAQVALRWLTQRGIVAIPKSTHKERMEQNFDIFDFTLTDEDMAQIAQMNQQDTGFINFGDPQFVKYLIENYG